MSTVLQNKGLDFKGITILKPIGTGLVFTYPAYGPDTFANVAATIEADDLTTPTMADKAALVYSAFNSDNKYSREIRKLMEDDEWLWGFTGILPSSKHDGYFIQDHPKIREGMPFMDGDELISRLGSKEANGIVYSDDGTIRFVRDIFGITGDNILPLRSHPYIIALAGEEGAQKLSEIEGYIYKVRPHVALPPLDDITRVPVLGFGCWYDGGRWFTSIGYNDGDRKGSAFGLLNKTYETSRTKE